MTEKKIYQEGKSHQCLADCFADSFSTYPEKKAIHFFRDGMMETEISYQELDQDANQMANTFLASGIKKGDRVILCLPKSLASVVAHIALQKTGAVAVPLNPGFRHSEMAYMLGDVQASLVISGLEQADIIKQAAPGTPLIIDTGKPYQDIDFFRSAPADMPRTVIEPDDPALIIYTSGTTGKPKGAVLTQKNLIHDAENIIRIWEIAESDVLCHALPLFHIHGLCFALHTTLMSGARMIMLDEFSPETVNRALAQKNGEYACTLFMGVPAMYGKMMDGLKDAPPDFSHIRLWASGSAPLLPKDFDRIKRIFGQKPVEREGMSETGMNFSNPLRGMKKPGSIGLPLPGLSVRITDTETKADVIPGQTGEIWLKGPAITPGYWRKPRETAEAYENGWFRTGDLGKTDEDGYYYLTDRIKNIIISGGENISPKEVETVINQLEEIAETAVVGIPDESWGEKVVAAIIRKTGFLLEAQDIQNYCREHLHKWKCPKKIVFVNELPKNKMGKILKKEVKKLF